MSASLATECNEVKERYDTCFLKWYSEKYLRNTATTDECEPLFRQYKTCLTKALKDRGIDQMLEEARADNKENDAEYMKPSFVQDGPNTWFTKEFAANAKLDIVEFGDGTLATLQFLRSQPFNLMGLPAELRLRILSYLVEATRLDVYTRGRLGPPQGMKLPSIVYATKTLRAQYLLVAIANTTFRVHNGPGNTQFQEWLTNTDLTDVSQHHKDGFDAVKALEFPYFSRFPHQALASDVPNSDVKLMLRCKNIESVRMNWVGSTLFDQAN
ncbi:Mitochondrial distribution and morphology protein 35 [Elasticomyces elasticus]|uniref:Mitochondrial distribution and morphology protein 35 n=1 Tax=Elasticomyces elasticus TaxID=574655 RepID=A0AAN7WJ66_9PEZI|nr:Mitochondrial distribution and morphology protein 35 [Elasticomyces elasticus]